MSHQIDELNEIRRLLGGNAVLLPVKHGEKRPVASGWQQTTLDQTLESEYEKRLLSGNIGVLVGRPSNGLCSIDIDEDAEVEPFLTLNPRLRESLRTKGARGCNIWVQITGEHPKGYAIKNNDGKQFGEWRADGMQTVFAGQHPNGKQYDIEIVAPPLSIDFDEIIWSDSLSLPWITTPKAAPAKTSPSSKVGANVGFPQPPHNGIHAWLMKAAWHCRINGLDEQATTEKLQAYDGTLRRPYQPNEVRDAVRTVYDSPMPEAGTRATESGIPEDRITFNPMDVFYDGPSGKYLVDAGDYFRTLGRKSPVITGVIRHFKTLGCDDKEAKEAARNEIADAEIDRHVEWSGNLAGHKKGLMESVDGRPMLILTSPAIPEPITAPCPVILEIIRQAFPDDTQRNVFLGWLSGSYKAVRAGQHHPAPMLVLAGKVNAGKSLLALIAGYVMGGRTANPHSAWSGSMVWNDDLFGSELLLLDDSTGSTDIRARLNFAASFKESIYDANVQLRKRHTTSMSARPVWRVMVCCNDNAESLLIVPPIGTDMADKIALLKVSKITPPVDASNTEGQAVLRAMIREELPAFAAILSRFQIPEELRDSRAGITAWRHPELAAALESTKPDHRLEELLETAIRSSYHLWPDLPATLKASEIEGRLLDKDSPVREQAKTLFGTWTAACGTYLGRLADSGSEIVKRGGSDGHAKIGSYTVSRP